MPRSSTFLESRSGPGKSPFPSLVRGKRSSKHLSFLQDPFLGLLHGLPQFFSPTSWQCFLKTRMIWSKLETVLSKFPEQLSELCQLTPHGGFIIDSASGRVAVCEPLAARNVSRLPASDQLRDGTRLRGP